MELALAFPYSLGLLAALNPCGFALLPAYLSYFVGSDRASLTAASGPGTVATATVRPTELMASVVRAITVGLTLTAGFVGVFGLFGVLFETILSQGAVLKRTGYFTIVIGIAMVGLGVVMLAGRQLNLRLPKMSRGTSSRRLGSVFMFGVSYAVVSLSCTIGLFIAATTATFTDQGTLDGIANFVAYGAGMGSLVTFLTLAVALARTNLINTMRGAMRWVSPLSGALLVMAGVYLVNYGWWELRLLDDPTASNALVEKFIEFQGAVNEWIQQVTPHRIGVICGLGVLGALLLGWRQLEADTTKRRAVTAAYVIVWLVVEFGFNRGEFGVLPVVRFVAGWPERVANWFSHPLRFGVALEAMLLTLVAWTVFRRLSWRRSPRRR